MILTSQLFKLTKLSSPKYSSVLLLIVIVGFILRLSTVTWGLPFSEYVHCPDPTIACFHADEGEALKPAIEFPQNYLSSDRFLGYGVTHAYLSSLISRPIHAITPELHYTTLLWLVQRLLSVTFGTLSIVLVYKITLSYFNNKNAAIFATLFTSFSPQLILTNASAKPDSALIFFLLLNFYVLSTFAKQTDYKKTLFFSLTSALLLGTKLTSIFFMPIVIGYILLKRIHYKHIFTYLVATFLLYITLHPYMLFDPESFIAYTSQEKQFHWQQLQSNPIQLLLQWMTQTSLASGFPIFIYLLFLDFRKLKLNHFLPATFIIIHYLFWGSSTTTGYIATLVPLFSIYAGFSVNILIRKKMMATNLLAILLTTAHIASSAFLITISINSRLNDPRLEASKFITNNIDENATIGFSQVSPEFEWYEHRWRYPQIDTEKFQIISMLENPDYLIVSSADIERVLPSLLSDDILPTLEWPHELNHRWYKHSPPSKELFQLYKSLFLTNDNETFALVHHYKQSQYRGFQTDPYPGILIFAKRPRYL